MTTVGLPVAWIVLLTLFEPPDWLPFIPDRVVDVVTPLMLERLLNIALFVPLGLALGGWWPRKPRLLWLAVLLSIAIECAQLWLPDRVSDPMDVVMNSLGAVAGFGVAVSAHHLRRWLRQRPRGR